MEQNLIVDLGKVIKNLMLYDKFYGMFLSSVNKKSDSNIPYAAIGVNKLTMEFTLYINPKTWFEMKTIEEKMAMLKHEAK